MIEATTLPPRRRLIFGVMIWWRWALDMLGVDMPNEKAVALFPTPTFTTRFIIKGGLIQRYLYLHRAGEIPTTPLNWLT